MSWTTPPLPSLARSQIYPKSQSQSLSGTSQISMDELKEICTEKKSLLAVKTYYIHPAKNNSGEQEFL